MGVVLMDAPPASQSLLSRETLSSFQIEQMS